MIILAFLFSAPAVAADMSIDMQKKSYSVEVAKIDVGDTITWLPKSKGHNVEIVASPNELKFKSKNNKGTSLTFDTPGIYYYWCTPHKSRGIIGLVVGGDTSNKDDIAKAKTLGKSKKKLQALLASL